MHRSALAFDFPHLLSHRHALQNDRSFVGGGFMLRVKVEARLCGALNRLVSADPGCSKAQPDALLGPERA